MVRQRTRASWKGTLNLGLVSVPVLAFNVAARRENEIHFHQLHTACHSRIRYEKVCPIHGEVPNEEIVSGYEFADDQYVEVRGEELERLRTGKEHSLSIDRFVHPDQIDPLYFDGRAFFLVPAGKQAGESYAVLRTAMENQGVYGVGQIVMSGKEQLVVVRPVDGLLTMLMLNYEYQLRDPERYLDRVDQYTAPPDEVALAEQLVAAAVEDEFNFDEYEDQYVEKLRTLIEAKVHGDQIVASPEAEVQPTPPTLRDALQRSLDRARLAQQPPQPVGGRGRRVS